MKPIFKPEALKKWMGEKIEVRRGCQACMTASKCPAAEIVRQISYGRGTVPDDYGSSEPVTGKIRKNVLEKIANVIVPDRVLNEYGVPEAERDLIMSASERIRKSIGLAPSPSDPREPDRSTTRAPATRARAKAQASSAGDTRLSNAAATGDLAVAIS